MLKNKHFLIDKGNMREQNNKKKKPSSECKPAFKIKWKILMSATKRRTINEKVWQITLKSSQRCSWSNQNNLKRGFKSTIKSFCKKISSSECFDTSETQKAATWALDLWDQVRNLSHLTNLFYPRRQLSHLYLLKPCQPPSRTKVKIWRASKCELSFLF